MPMKIKLLLLLLIAYLPLCGQEVPRIIAYQTEDYGAGGQNWMITQGCDGSIFVANSAGVLRYNGFNWQLIPFKERRRVRSIFLGKDCRVYCGGYRDFGVLEQVNHEWTYRSIADTVFNNRQEEVWHIFSDHQKLFFQSFADVYQYDYENVKLLDPPENIMFGTTLNEKVLFPKIRGGIFDFTNQQFTTKPLQGDFPANAKITGLCSLTENEILVATQFNGLYILKGAAITSVDRPIQELARRDQINRLLRLSDGRIVLGTIQDGIFILDQELNIKYHINRRSGLSKNTVLALFEDQDRDLWVGTNKGVNLIKLSHPNRYYYDRNDLIGNVISSIYHEDRLFLGTNKGLYIRSDQGLEAVPAIQNQVWSFLSDQKGNLLVGHNEGTYLYQDDQINKISTVTGGLKMTALPNGKILQSTYTGWILFKPTETAWAFEQRIYGTSVAFLNFLLVDHTVYGINSNEGLFRQVFNEDFTEVIESQKLNGSIPVPGTAEVVFYSQNEAAYFCMSNDCFQIIGDTYQKLTIGQDSTLLRQLDNKQRYQDQLVSIDGGYAKIVASKLNSIDSIKVEYLLINGQFKTIKEQPLSLESTENSLVLQLKSAHYPIQINDYEYAIAYEGGSNYWSNVPKDGKIQLQALQTGTYQILLRTKDQVAVLPILSFEIFPPWYASWPGGLLYLGITFLGYYFIVRYQKQKARQTQKRLLAEKEREMEKERILAKNNELEREVNYKSQMLANSTMTLIQKNKMLNELKGFIDDELQQAKSIRKTKNRLMHLINRNLNSDEDWQIFEHNFNQIHQAFMERLQGEFEELSINDLKLAAYIRIGLTSKEIAPLMNISFRSVENNRSRLRKKLQLQATDNLKDFLLHY